MRSPNKHEWCKELAQYKGKPLCSECWYVKDDGKDGIVVPGKWHNKFDKKEATEKDKRNVGRNGIIQ